MANSFSVKTSVVAGVNNVLSGMVPFSGNIGCLVLSNDVSVTWEIYLDKVINDLERVVLSLSSASTGGTLVGSTFYYFRITTVDVNGIEGPPCDLISKKTGSSNTSKITATWLAIAGAASYNIYCSSIGGQETFQINTTSLSFVLTIPPQNQSLQIPTVADINMIMAANDAKSIPMSGVFFAGNIRVFAKAGAGGNVAFSCVIAN